jgi:hypothetical protein
MGIDISKCIEFSVLLGDARSFDILWDFWLFSRYFGRHKIQQISIENFQTGPATPPKIKRNKKTANLPNIKHSLSTQY